MSEGRFCLAGVGRVVEPLFGRWLVERPWNGGCHHRISGCRTTVDRHACDVASMQLLAALADEQSRVADRSRRGDGPSGYDARGSADSVWLLHAMYEIADPDRVRG
jgi:hypothetical protein